MDFLGHVLFLNNIKLDPKKIQAIKEWQSPTMAKGVKSLFGLANFYRKFIMNLLALAKPLMELIKELSLNGWKNSTMCLKSWRLGFQ